MPIAADKAQDISASSKKILTALGYNVAKMKYIEGKSYDDPPPAQQRYFQAENATVAVLEVSGEASPRASIQITRKTLNGGTEIFWFNYEKNILLSSKEAGSRVEAVAINLSTRRTFHGNAALIAARPAGSHLHELEPKAGTELISMHDNVAKAFLTSTSPSAKPAR